MVEKDQKVLYNTDETLWSPPSTRVILAFVCSPKTFAQKMQSHSKLKRIPVLFKFAPKFVSNGNLSVTVWRVSKKGHIESVYLQHYSASTNETSRYSKRVTKCTYVLRFCFAKSKFNLNSLYESVPGISFNISYEIEMCLSLSSWIK